MEALVAKLDRFFDASAATPPAKTEGGIRLPDSYYWHGNEPDIHAAYMYALAGRPRAGAPRIRWVMESKYTDGPDGLDGNDDSGTLSAWYVFTAMGVYPIAGTDEYVIGSPVFERVEIVDRFAIEAAGASVDAMYVKSAELGGNPLATQRVRHGEWAAAKRLRLEMTAAAP